MKVTEVTLILCKTCGNRVKTTCQEYICSFCRNSLISDGKLGKDVEYLSTTGVPVPAKKKKKKSFDPVEYA
jgi:hypothetical protein